METFHLPSHEIKKRFTRSELVLMSWRSQEQSYNFRKKHKKSSDYEDDELGNVDKVSKKKRKTYADGIGPERAPDEFFDENGDLNLSKVTGEQARGYMERVLRIPFPPGISKIRDDSPEARQIRQAYGIR